MSPRMKVRDDRLPLVLPDEQGAIICFRGKVGFAWMGVRGGETWYLTRRDAYEQYGGWREVTDEKLLEEIGSELQVLHQGGYDPAEHAPIQWPHVWKSKMRKLP